MSSNEAHNPYAPPATEVVSAAADSGLKHRSVLLMVVLLVVTLGFYYPLWFLRRRPGLNRLGSSRELHLWPFVMFAVYFAGQMVLALLEGDRRPEEVWGPEMALFLSALQLTLGIMMIVQCFAIKNIIEDYAQGPGDDDGMFKPHVQLSGLMTFFFSIFYLQYAINKYVVGARR